MEEEAEAEEEILVVADEIEPRAVVGGKRRDCHLSEARTTTVPAKSSRLEAHAK